MAIKNSAQDYKAFMKETIPEWLFSCPLDVYEQRHGKPALLNILSAKRCDDPELADSIDWMLADLTDNSEQIVEQAVEPVSEAEPTVPIEECEFWDA